jgi:hypothetical protein
LPASAKDFWFYHNGFLSKSSEYCKFTCGSRDDCLKAVEAVGGVSPADLKPWKLSKYVAVMEGTAYRFRGSPASPKLHGNPWDVRGIKNGVVYEHAQLGWRHDEMKYRAIDFDTNRVFCYDDSAFSTDEYRPGGDAKTTNLSGG